MNRITGKCREYRNTIAEVLKLVDDLKAKGLCSEDFEPPLAELKRSLRRLESDRTLDLLHMRSLLQRRVESLVEDGMIAVRTSGMDCDCVSGDDCRIMRYRGVRQCEKWFDDYMADAEGPQSMWFEKPSQSPEYHDSRDLAMEAHEDGHDHCVTTANPETDREDSDRDVLV